jgi:hypothetical protein
MPVRFYFTDDAMGLEKKYIPTLATTVFKSGEELVTSLLAVLPVKKKILTLSDKKFLVLAGTTAELKEFRAGLKSEKVDAIGLEQAVGDPLVTWCTRVDVKHPDKKLESKTTVTLVLIGLQTVFTRMGVSWVPKPPWQVFPHAKGVGGDGGFLHLDKSFENELDVAQKHPKAN